MKFFYAAIGLLVSIFWLANCKTNNKAQLGSNPLVEKSDPIFASRERYTNQVKKMMVGREQAAVDSVFQNLKVLGGFPAENLVFAMEKWSEALGVGCEHCHIPNEWHQDLKPEKEIARQMVEMGERLNAELRKIKGLKSEKPTINCFSCHRGELIPAKRIK